MHYIVLDLEWNQPFSKERAVRLPSGRLLMSEVIQIGAVRLDEERRIADHFLSAVAPRYYRELHYKVKQLTGLSGKQLNGAPGLAEAAEAFREWCGEDFVFLSWSNMDLPILLENLELHGLDSGWVGAWYDLQQIFNVQTNSTGGQKSLTAALEQLQIQIDTPLHDALNDAFATARIAQRLDIPRGIREYYQRGELPKGQLHKDAQGRQMCAYATLTGMATREQLWREPRTRALFCPECGQGLRQEGWTPAGEDGYTTWASCAEHGRFLCKLRLKNLKRSKWTAALSVYTQEEAEKPALLLPPKRRRSRGGRRGKGTARGGAKQK